MGLDPETLDERIEKLRNGDTLTENEVRALCEKVSQPPKRNNVSGIIHPSMRTCMNGYLRAHMMGIRSKKNPQYQIDKRTGRLGLKEPTTTYAFSWSVCEPRSWQTEMDLSLLDHYYLHSPLILLVFSSSF